MEPKDKEPLQRVFFNHYPASDGTRAALDTLILIPVTNYGKYHLKGLAWLKELQLRRYLN